MTQEKLGFEQFLEAADPGSQAFVLDLHNYLLDNGCKPTFEEKKTSFMASYKHTKSKKSVINLFIKKQGLLVRIYGENANSYLDFLNTLPPEMVEAVAGAPACRRLVHNTCSPKCSGYDVVIGSERFQKCRYGGFEFLVTDTSDPYIKSFIENEIKERVVV